MGKYTIRKEMNSKYTLVSKPSYMVLTSRSLKTRYYDQCVSKYAHAYYAKQRPIDVSISVPKTEKKSKEKEALVQSLVDILAQRCNYTRSTSVKRRDYFKTINYTLERDIMVDYEKYSVQVPRLHEATNTVHVGKYQFKRHDNCRYKDRHVKEGYQNLYIECFSNWKVEDTGLGFSYSTGLNVENILDTVILCQDKKWNYVIVQHPAAKVIQYNKPKGFVLHSWRLTNNVITRLRELLKYKVPVRVITDLEGINEKFVPKYDTQSYLDYAYYTPVIGREKTNQSPFIAEQPETYNRAEAQLIKDLHYQHEKAVYAHVLELTKDLAAQAKDQSSWYLKEGTYEYAVKLRNAQTTQANKVLLANKRWNTVKARMYFKANAYGIDLKFAESVPNTDKFSWARDFLNADIRENDNSVAKAMVSRHQKQKINELASTDAEFAQAAEMLKWFEQHPEEWYLDPEHTSKCVCGYPLQSSMQFCDICGCSNDNYIEETRSRDSQWFDEKIQKYQAREKLHFVPQAGTHLDHINNHKIERLNKPSNK